MTNRQWLESLSDKELALVLFEGDFKECSICPHDAECDGLVPDYICMDAIEPWLKAEHKEG